MNQLAPPRRIASSQVVLPEGTTPGGTRGRILEASLSLFADLGFHGTSIRLIGASAGINSATLYSHYAAKEEILRDLVMIGMTELHARITAAVADAAVADAPASRLAALVHAHVSAHASFTMLAVVTNSELHVLSPEFAEPAIALRSELQELLRQVLAEGERAGVFHMSDPSLAAHAISGMGVQVGHWFSGDASVSVERVAAQYAEFALRIAGAS